MTFSTMTLCFVLLFDCIWRRFIFEHIFFTIYRHTFSQTFKQIFIFNVPSWRCGPWTSAKRESKLVCSSITCVAVTGSCTHLKKNEYLCLSSCNYLLSHVFAAIDLIGSKATNQKLYIYICLASAGIDPRTFQSWVYCLAIWTITPNLHLKKIKKQTELKLIFDVLVCGLFCCCKK